MPHVKETVMGEFGRLNEQIEYGLALLARLVEAQERIAKATEEQAYSVDCMTAHIENLRSNT
jgi:hypothetical protein